MYYACLCEMASAVFSSLPIPLCHMESLSESGYFSSVSFLAPPSLFRTSLIEGTRTWYPPTSTLTTYCTQARKEELVVMTQLEELKGEVSQGSNHNPFITRFSLLYELWAREGRVQRREPGGLEDCFTWFPESPSPTISWRRDLLDANILPNLP